MTDKRLAPILKVLERLPISAVVASPLTGRILWVNSQNIELAGARHPSDLLGKSILDFIDPSQHAVALRDIAAIAIGQSPPPVVYHLRRLDGGTADGQISSVPLIYEGQPAMLSLIAEVTEREAALRELRESEERYRLLVDTLPVGLTVVVEDRIVYANRTIASLLRCTGPAELVGRSLYDFVESGEHKRVREFRKKALLTKQPPAPYDVRLIAANGDCLEATVSSEVIRWGGQVATQTIIRRAGDCAE